MNFTPEATTTPRQILAQAAQAMQRGDSARSKALLEEGLKLAPNDPGINTNLALLLLHDGDVMRALTLLDNAIQADPYLYPARLHKAHTLEQLGRRREAMEAYIQGLSQAGDLSQAPRGLQQLIAHARQYVEQYETKLEAFLDQEMRDLRAQYGAAAFERINETLAIRHAKVPRQLQQPTFMFFPGLPQRSFYDREEFPWLESIESHTEVIREEFLQILKTDLGFHPYVEKPGTSPTAQWKGLNHSLNWSACHLYLEGALQEDNAQRCPRTLKLVEQLPLSRIPGREPEVFFSMLKPGTHIPPHTGALNTRLVVHLPLIIPPDCAIRVGNQTREWEPGRCLIFDDTMEHEAWNRSDQLRAVFIFNIWNPGLSEAERAGMAAMVSGIGRFEP